MKYSLIRFTYFLIYSEELTPVSSLVGCPAGEQCDRRSAAAVSARYLSVCQLGVNRRSVVGLECNGTAYAGQPPCVPGHSDSTGPAWNASKIGKPRWRSPHGTCLGLTIGGPMGLGWVASPPAAEGPRWLLFAPRATCVLARSVGAWGDRRLDLGVCVNSRGRRPAMVTGNVRC